VKVRNLLSVDCHDVPPALARTVATTLLREGTDVCSAADRECGSPVYVQADTEFEDVEQAMGNVSVAMLPILDEGQLIGLVERNVFTGESSRGASAYRAATSGG
jgi:CBS-domain-containing membrane protein